MLIRIESGMYNRRYFEKHYNIPRKIPVDLKELLEESLSNLELAVSSAERKLEEINKYVEKYSYLKSFNGIQQKRNEAILLHSKVRVYLSTSNLIREFLNNDNMDIDELKKLSDLHIIKLK